MSHRVLALAGGLAFLISVGGLCDVPLGARNAYAADGAKASTKAPSFPQAHYKVEEVVPPSAMHGVHGLAIGPDGALYGASLTGYSLYRIDPKSGAVTTYVGAPYAAADDLAFSPDGAVYWTTPSAGTVLFRGKDGKIRTAAKDMLGANGIGFTKNGRLFVSTLGGKDSLYELDPQGVKPARLVAEKLGGMDGFQIADDNTLYGPLMPRGQLVKMNIESGEKTVIADGLDTPSALKIDAEGYLLAVELRTGKVVRVNPKTGEKVTIANVPPTTDNLAIARDGTIYVSSPAFNGITAINPKSYETRRVTWGEFSSPGMITTTDIDGREQILAADYWGPSAVDPRSGGIVHIKRGPGIFAATSVAAHKDAYVLGSVSARTLWVVERSSGKNLARLDDFGAPYDIKSLADGFLVADYKAGRLIKIADDAARTRLAVTEGLAGPVGLADAGNGVFYVSEYNAGQITRLDMASNARTPVITKLKGPEGIALAPNGRLIVAEVGRKRVLSVDTATGAADILADNMTIGLQGGASTPPPFLPTGVAVTRDGTIYVTGDIANTLYRLSPPR